MSLSCTAEVELDSSLDNLAKGVSAGTQHFFIATVSLARLYTGDSINNKQVANYASNDVGQRGPGYH